jgi:NAD(P)-dependent dehydrogenase (short-subunit alcohol dehydrogenase family)
MRSFLECDIATPIGAESCIDDAVKLLPGNRLDVLVNNAGAALLGLPFGSAALTADKFDFMFDLDVKAPFLLTHHAVKHLEKTKGSIVNLSSIAAQRPTLGLGTYCMAKAAVDMLTKVSALELAPKGIRVNSVAPAVTETNFHAAAGKWLRLRKSVNCN